MVAVSNVSLQVAALELQIATKTLPDLVFN